MEDARARLEQVHDARALLALEQRIGLVVQPEVREGLVQLELAPVPVDAVERREEALADRVAHEAPLEVAPARHDRAVRDHQERRGGKALPGRVRRLECLRIEAGLDRIDEAHPALARDPLLSVRLSWCDEEERERENEVAHGRRG